MQRRLGIGKRTEPVVRRHLAAPYIFLRLPRFLCPGGGGGGGKKRRTFPFLLLFVSTPRVSIPRSPIPESSLLCPRAKISPKRNDSLRFDIFLIVPPCLFGMPIDITIALFSNEFTIFLRRFFFYLFLRL